MIEVKIQKGSNTETLIKLLENRQLGEVFMFDSFPELSAKEASTSLNTLTRNKVLEKVGRLQIGKTRRTRYQYKEKAVVVHMLSKEEHNKLRYTKEPAPDLPVLGGAFADIFAKPRPIVVGLGTTFHSIGL